MENPGLAVISPVQSPPVQPHPQAGSNPFGNDFDDEDEMKKGAKGGGAAAGGGPKKRLCDRRNASQRSFQDECLFPDGDAGDDAIELRSQRSLQSGIYNEESVNNKIHRSLKGFSSIEEVIIKPFKVKGYLNNIVSKSFTYAVKKGRGIDASVVDDEHLAKRHNFCTMKTEPRHCDCFLWGLTFGCLGRSTRVNVMDCAENHGFYFNIPGCGSPRMEVYTTCDDKLVGKIARKCMSPEFTCTDQNGNILFTAKGPAYSMLFKRGKMKFHAVSHTADGKEAVVGMTRNENAGCFVSFGVQCKKDRQTKLLFLATALLIESVYYRHKFEVNNCCS